MNNEKEVMEEIEEFKREKERIREIVGEIGGVNNTKQNKLVNRLLTSNSKIGTVRGKMIGIMYIDSIEL